MQTLGTQMIYTNKKQGGKLALPNLANGLVIHKEKASH